MRKLKLSTLGFASLFMLSFGLDTSIQKDTSLPQSKNIILYAEHGKQI